MSRATASQPTCLLLASASPRRLDLLRGIGLSPICRPSGLSEDERPGESPRATVLRLAEAKGRAVAATLDPSEPACVVLAADTAVVLQELMLGKPRDAIEAAEMLRSLRGRVHEVMTAVFLMRTDDGRAVCEIETSRVRFRDYDDETIRTYVAGGEPLDKAGAYGIQGGGAVLADRVEGSWTNVVGLPVERLEKWMKRIEINLRNLRETNEA